MEPWSIVQTRDLVKACFGSTQLDLIKPSLNSVAERKDFAAYHYQEVDVRLKEFRSKFLDTPSRTLLLLSADEDYRRAFEHLMLEVGAHSLACVQSLHSIQDILAHVVYFGLGFNLQENHLKEQDVGYANVIKLLEKHNHLSKVSTAMEKLGKHANYPHLEGLANKSKHQSIVRSILNEDLTGKRKLRHELHFSEFMHKGRRYPKIELESFLSEIYDHVTMVILDVGNALNLQLSKSTLQTL